MCLSDQSLNSSALSDLRVVPPVIFTYIFCIELICPKYISKAFIIKAEKMSAGGAIGRIMGSPNCQVSCQHECCHKMS